MSAFAKRGAVNGMCAIFALVAVFYAELASAQGDAGLRQAIAQASAGNPSLAAFYDSRRHEPIWVGNANRRRANDYLDALDEAGDHALPAASYRGSELAAVLRSASGAADLARTEVAFSTSFLKYAKDIQSGILDPQRVDSGIIRPAPRRDPVKTLAAFAQSSPSGFIAALPPQTREYQRLMREKSALETASWGATVSGSGFQPGQFGEAVSALTSRLTAMGYLRGVSNSYDETVRQAVIQFQQNHGLATDGVAGPGTLAELNKQPEDRLQQVIVAMERERWSNLPQGRRNIQVNIPDFTARIVEDGRTVFETRAVVGAGQTTHRTPEFSDVMEFMVVNPTWNVPQSITLREYLPLLKENPNAVPQLQLIDAAGQPVSRASVDFAAYGSDFPYRLKEPPSQGNALGQVKFMFPNRHNIYLHDTPAKSLFSRDSRAYSHGCVRLNDPFEFAYHLLEPQTPDPQGHFQRQLDTGRETVIDLEEPLRVHLLYRTAFALDKEIMQYRRDVYGRDAKIFAALSREGVSLRGARG